VSEPNLYAHLIASAGVAALVGQRVYAQLIPQQVRGDPKAYPCAVFSLVSLVDASTQCETIPVPQGTWQIDAYAMDRDSAVLLASEIRRAMVDYVGLMGDVHVSSCKRSTCFDVGPEPEPGLYRRTQTFTIWYAES